MQLRSAITDSQAGLHRFAVAARVGGRASRAVSARARRAGRAGSPAFSSRELGAGARGAADCAATRARGRVTCAKNRSQNEAGRMNSRTGAASAVPRGRAQRACGSGSRAADALRVAGAVLELAAWASCEAEPRVK